MNDRGNYLKKILDMPTRPGQAVVVEVRHDPGCPRLTGGVCTCRPDVVQLNRYERRLQKRRGRRR